MNDGIVLRDASLLHSAAVFGIYLAWGQRIPVQLQCYCRKQCEEYYQVRPNKSLDR